MTTVLVVDDNPMVTELLELAIGRDPRLRCVASALSADEALTRMHSMPADVVVVDHRLGPADGVALTRVIKKRWPASVVVLLTHDPTRTLSAEATAAGASALLPKHGALADLIAVILAATAASSTPSRNHLRAPSDRRPAHTPLTRRENDVLRALAGGRDIRAVSRALGISVHTGRSHVKSILAKLGAHSQLEAVAVAQRRGLLAGGDG